MAKQKITGLSASLLGQTPEPVPETTPVNASSPSSRPGRTIVQTVKVPQDVYVLLKTVGARERRSSQDILLAALRDYLKRFTY